MRNKLTSLIAMAVLLMVALPACGGSSSSTSTYHKEKEKQMPAAAIGDNGSVTAVPDKPTEKKLVWDFANVIDDTQEKALEDSLESFSRNTSNQILVITVTSLGDYEPSQYATELGRKWGVGHEDDDNGVVMLIKAKTENEGGQAFIATGYGVEGALPDALCKRIIEKEMIPHFKEDDYAGGVWSALSVIMPAMKGEFNEEEYMNEGTTGDAILGLIVFIAIICFIVVAMKKGGTGGTGTGTNTRTYTGGPIIFPGGYSGRSSGGSSWGGGSSSGGWGGFGGGSFGGGGAGGSW